LENLKVNGLTIWLPDSDSEVSIDIRDGDVEYSSYIPFADLDAWVSSVSKQIKLKKQPIFPEKPCPTEKEAKAITNLDGCDYCYNEEDAKYCSQCGQKLDWVE